jgi:hypothetical protein
MCNLNSITTNQAAIIAPFRVINRHVSNGAKNDTQDTAVAAHGRWLTDACLAHEISP